MEFMLVSTAMIVIVVLVLVLLARAYPGSGADLVDWKPTRSFEAEAQLELDDVQQMMDAQNEMRRRRGEADITHQDLDRMVAEDEAVRARAHPDLTSPEPKIDLEPGSDPSPEGAGSDPSPGGGSAPSRWSGSDPT